MTTNKGKQTLVPKLRFKGFKENWDIGKMIDYSTFYNGKAFKQEELLDSGRFPVLRVGNLFTNNNWYFSDLELEENKYIENNDLIYAWSATFGPRIWQGEKVIYHYHIWKVDCKIEKVNKWFFFQILDNATAKMKANSSNGFALLHITKGTIENWNVNIPSLPEQQKIASFLSAVDEKIQLLIRKKELLENYKKGSMQQLFSQKLRFKDDTSTGLRAGNGKDFPDWEEKRLATITNFIQGDGNWILSENITKDEKYSIIQLGNIGLGEFIDKELKTLSEADFKKVKGTLIKRGDLLLNRMVDDDKLNVCVFNYDGNYITSVDICWIRYGDGIINLFLMYLLITRENQKRLLSLSSGSGRVRISKKNFFEKFIFQLPCVEEQQKIAAFLSAIDDKIEAVNQQIIQSQTFKRGLLQKMFV